MTAITNFDCFSTVGKEVRADAHGNNRAFQCMVCEGPVLAVMLSNQRGVSRDKPTLCKTCGSSYWVEVLESKKRLIVHRIVGQFSGRFRLGHEPRLTAPHNAASWRVIEAMLSAYGGADYGDFVMAVRQHADPSGGRAFVDYCIRNGWLIQAEEIFTEDQVDTNFSKECTICHVTLPLSAFSIRPRQTDGHGDWCPDCESAYSKNYAKWGRVSNWPAEVEAKWRRGEGASD